MTVNRSFNHDSEEWHQAIVDCLDDKIRFDADWFLIELMGPFRGPHFVAGTKCRAVP